MIFYDEYVSDVINNPKFLKKGPFNLVMRKFLWSRDEKVTSSMEINIMFNQVMELLLSGFQRAEISDCTTAAALQLKAVKIDLEKKDQA